MTKWEYTHVTYQGRERFYVLSVDGQTQNRFGDSFEHRVKTPITEYANGLGAEGWELIGFAAGTGNTYKVWFKRLMTEPHDVAAATHTRPDHTR